MPETPERLGSALPSPEQPKRSLEDIAAERETGMANVSARQAEAVSFDDRCAAIGDCLMDIYAGGDEIAAKLEPYIDEGRFPDEAATALAEYEAGKRDRRPDYDITAKPPKFIALTLRKAFEAQEKTTILATEEQETTAVEVIRTGEQAETLQTVIDAERVADERAAEATAVDDMEDEKSAEALRQGFFEAHKDSDPFELLEAAAASPDLSEAERDRAATFLRIRSLAQTEEDAALVTKASEAQNFSSGMPDPVRFIHAEIFSSPDHDTGFSDAMQEALAAEFKIPKERLHTGTDLARAADRIITDPDTGEERPRYNVDNKLKVRDTPSAAGNLYLYVDDNGDRIVEVTLSDGRHREIPIPTGPDYVDELRTYTNWLGLFAQLEEDGQTDFLGEGVGIETAILSLRDPMKRLKLENTVNALLGGSAGFDGGVLFADDYEQIGRYVNWLSGSKGDAQIGDVDRDAAVTRRTTLGIHPDGDPQAIHYEVLRAACLHMQENWLASEPNYAALQAHLSTLFPDFVAPPDDDIMERDNEAA